jgi:peptidoglycan hydrolase-like protein with peptidoglycan-binding domain
VIPRDTISGRFAMSSELNFEAEPFEYFGEATQSFSEASVAEPEQFMGSHGGHHHGGSHHHRHRRRHRFGASQWPVSGFPMDDWPYGDSDDGFQPPPEGAGDSEAEGEAEFRHRRGRSNWRRQHHGGWGGRSQWGQQSSPFDGSPFGAFDNSQFDPTGFELEGETRIRDHRRHGAHLRHAGAAASPWSGRIWRHGAAPEWQRARPYWGMGRHPRWDGAGDSHWWRRWGGVPPDGRWPPHARGGGRWPSAAPLGPYSAPSGPDFTPDPYSIDTAAGPSEYVRWTQAALNDVLGVQLPINGVADATTRSAIRAFQQQQGLPADGVIGPDTQHALAAARAASSSSAGAAPQAPGIDGPPPSSVQSAASGPPSAPDPSAGAGAAPSPTPGATATPEFDLEWENYATVNTPVTAGCTPEPGEVAASHSEAGILAKEVENTSRGILIADFGIDWRSVKERAKRELNPCLHMLETDPTISEIWICGYTDCIGPGDGAYHTWLRTERARRVFKLLGPVARSKVKSVGPAPIGSYFGPNSDRVGRAQNRSVLIVYKRVITMTDEPISVVPCQKRLMDQAQQRLRSSRTMDPAVKTRLQAALNATVAGRDESFIRPGSTSGFPFHWSSITTYFIGLCNQLGGGAPSDSTLERKLTELDQDIVNGRESFNRERRTASGYRKTMLDAEFSGRFDALIRNKPQTVYAGY